MWNFDSIHVNNDMLQHIISTCDLILTRVLPRKMIAVRRAIESQITILYAVYNVLAKFQFGKKFTCRPDHDKYY